MLRPDEIKIEETSSFPECDVCGEEHETSDCPQLQNGKRIENARAPSRARLTLPSNLRIKKLKDGQLTIVVRENISKGTRFGPFEAQVVYDSLGQSQFPLKIFEKNGDSYYLDTSNEEECNWMYFVLAAQTRREQNLMAYQLHRDIYFSALRDIRIHEELRVWYATHYAKKMAMELPWPPDETDDPNESNSVPATTPEKAVREIPVEESHEPKRKRGRKRKIYHDFVETPDLDDPDEATEELTSTRESLGNPSPEINADQHEWLCSQCGQSFQSCADFARHLRQHYHPRKSGETNKKQKRAAQMRPKNFGCQFCDAKFSSSKLLQRHRLRLHRRQIGSKKTSDAITATIENNPDYQLQETVVDARFDEETVAEEVDYVEHKTRHISDNDAASILLEIEANADKPEEGSVEICGDGATSASMPVIVMAENEITTSGVGDCCSAFGTDMDYLNTVIDENDLGEEDTSMEAPATGSAMLEEVTVHAVEELTDGTSYDLAAESKDDGARFNCDICNESFQKSQDLYRHIGTHLGDFSRTTSGKGLSRKDSQSKHDVAAEEAPKADFGNDSEEDSNVEHFCPFCQKSFAKIQLLRRHVTKHTGQFTCGDCGKSYCSRNILKSHVCSKKPEEKGSYSCEICHKTFSKESYLEKHIPVHTGAHACPNCGKWLRSNDSLNNHLRICWQVKELESTGSAACPHCKQVFTDTRSFRRHMYDHTHVFVCTNCGARFRNKVSEMQHLCHAQRIVECDICEEKFPNVAELNKHKSSHGEEQIKCDACGMRFHQNELPDHRCNEKSKKKRSKKGSKAPPNLQPLICEVCGSLFSSTSSLNVHKRLHGNKLFACETCGKEFHRKDLMLDHCAVHGEAAVPCPVCNKMFKTKKSLDVHMLIHDGVKRFACDVCGKQFHQKGNLLKHEEVHNPERKYPCTFCSKMFSTKEYLAIHVLEHTRGRVHACDMCDKRYVKEHQLKAHQRTFHTNMAWICPFCNLSVKLKHSLKRHLNKKHADQRSLWSNSEQIDAMLVTNTEREEEEDPGNDAESVQLMETVNQVQDGTEVLLAVAGIGSEALQQALASGTARIQQGSIPNTIEISLPAENDMVDNAFMNGVLEGDELQTQIIHLPLTSEMEDAGEIQPMNVDDMTTEEAMETRITVLSGEEQFQTDGLTGNETIVLDNGTILQQGVSQDGEDVLFYVLTTDAANCATEEAPG